MSNNHHGCPALSQKDWSSHPSLSHSVTGRGLPWECCDFGLDYSQQQRQTLKGGWRERERESEQERESESVLPCPRATKMNKALCVQGVWSPMELFGRQFLCYISLLKFFMRFSERR